MELETLVSQPGRVKPVPMVSDGIVYSSEPTTISSIIQTRFQSFLLTSPVETPSFILKDVIGFPQDYTILLKKLQSLTSVFDNDFRARSLLSKVDPYISLKKELEKYQIPNVTNASLKFIELMRFVQKEGGQLCVKSMFDNASLPGAFIITQKYLFETECKEPLNWVASSYVTADETYPLKDDYFLVENYRERWMMDLAHEGNVNGDVRDPMVVQALEKRVKKVFPAGVDLYTSDIGVESKGNHELETSDLNYGQIVLGLMTLAKGGTFIIKMFTATTPFTVSLIYNLVPLFDKLYLTKPLTSRQANSESYLVGIRFKGISDRIREELLSNISKVDVSKQFGDIKYLSRRTDSLYKAENVLLGAYQSQMLRFIFFSSPIFNTRMESSWNKVFVNLRKEWIKQMDLKVAKTPLVKKRESYARPQSSRIINDYEVVSEPSQKPISTESFQTSSYARASAPILSSSEPEGERPKRIRKVKEEKKSIRKIINIQDKELNMASYNPEEISPGESTQLYNKRLEIYRRLLTSNIHKLVADSESRIQVNTDNLDVFY